MSSSVRPAAMASTGAENSRPIVAATSASPRAPGERRSSRAVITAWTVGVSATARCTAAETRTHRLDDEQRVALRLRPQPAGAPGGSARPPTRAAISAVAAGPADRGRSVSGRGAAATGRAAARRRLPRPGPSLRPAPEPQERSGRGSRRARPCPCRTTGGRRRRAAAADLRRADRGVRRRGDGGDFRRPWPVARPAVGMCQPEFGKEPGEFGQAGRAHGVEACGDRPGPQPVDHRAPRRSAGRLVSPAVRHGVAFQAARRPSSSTSRDLPIPASPGHRARRRGPPPPPATRRARPATPLSADQCS